jgi:lipopolysaccharide/colanic/teichoic acid biosynthesis glycosyltransferase
LATIAHDHGALGLRKRMLDIAIACLLLLIALPLMLVASLLIRLDSPGPALFRQRRGGLGGEAFVIYKFRTMTVAEDADVVTQAQRGDRRCTEIGRFLRKTSMDELPQLINVLLGDMSLVGPRPHALAHDALFQTQVPQYRRRFNVKPGITGLAQIRGFRGESGTLDAITGRVDSDLDYIDSWSFWGDIKLLIATLKIPLDSRAY